MTDIEEHIRRAIEEGKFDDLPGKSQPVHLDDNPLADEDWRLAYHMLRSAGFTLPWIEQLKDLDTEIEAARASLRRAWEWRVRNLNSGPGAGITWQEQSPPVNVEAEWQRAVQSFVEQAERINKRIASLNLQVPAAQFQRIKLKPRLEIERIKSDI